MKCLGCIESIVIAVSLVIQGVTSGGHAIIGINYIKCYMLTNYGYSKKVYERGCADKYSISALCMVSAEVHPLD